MKVFAYVWKYKFLAFLIAVILLAQTMLGFAIPYVTSDIINVGIQQAGTEYAAPEKISEDTLNFIEQKNNTSLIKESYTKNKGTNTYTLNSTGQQNVKEISEEMTLPLAFYYSNEYQDAKSTDATTQQKSYENFQKKYNNKAITQKAINATNQELKNNNVDTGAIQMNYLKDKGWLMIALSFLIVVLTFCSSSLVTLLTSKIGKEKRSEFFSKIMQFSSEEINKFSESSLITRATNDIQFIQNMSALIITTVVNAPLCIIAGFYFAWATAPTLSWILILAALAIFIAASIMVKLCKPIFIRMQWLIDGVNLRTREMLAGLYVSRAFSREKYDNEKFAQASTDLFKNQLFMGRIMAIITPLLGLGASGIAVLVLLVGAYYISLGTLQVGNLVAFTSYASIVIGAFTSLGLFLGSIPRATVAVNRVEEVINAEIKIKNEDDPNQDFDDITTIKFENVSYAYNNSKTNAVEGLNFTIKPGTTTGIVGTTGSGKTTIVKLLMRFQDASSGYIYFGSNNIKNLPLDKYRSLFSYAPQQSFLFSGTVKDNINFGIKDPQQKNSEEYLYEKISDAQASDFIKNQESLNKNISQDSTNISGGQKQRLSIARALAANSPILLFDDCFTALDYKIEKQLRDKIREKTKGKTKIIVSSRLSSILDADQIIVLDEGKMVGCGTHKDLLKSCSEYIKIAKSQLDNSVLKDGGEQDEQ